MTLRRNNPLPEVLAKQEGQPLVEQEVIKSEDQETTKLAQELANMPAAVVDSSESIIDDKQAFDDPDDVKMQQDVENVGHTTGLQDPYKDAGFTPAIEVTKSKHGFTGEDTRKQLNSIADRVRKQARPAEEFDIEKLDESMIMNLPEIKAVSYELIDMLNPKFKDKTLRGRWANFKNHVEGNLGRYLAMGYEYATPDDIDVNRYKLHPSMIDGTQIKYYDVVLLKINVIRLMQLYKTNIVRAINKMARAQQRGINEAQRQFNVDLSSSNQMLNRYSQVKQALGGREPIEFYTPGVEDSAHVNVG